MLAQREACFPVVGGAARNGHWVFVACQFPLIRTCLFSFCLQRGDNDAAVEAYTAAMAIEPANTKFAAVLLSNRAAAHMKYVYGAQHVIL